MSLEKTAKFAGDFRTIWLGVAMLLAGAAWAGDLRWMQIAEAGGMATKIELTALQNRLEELIVQKNYAKTAEQKQVMQALIELKRSQIDALRNNPH